VKYVSGVGKFLMGPDGVVCDGELSVVVLVGGSTVVVVDVVVVAFCVVVAIVVVVEVEVDVDARDGGTSS